MFKKFVPSEHAAGQTPVKSSVQRGIFKKIAEQYPELNADALELLLPKKEQAVMVKCQDHVNLLLHGVTKEVLFFNQREGPFYPTLRTLHQTGDFMDKVTVDVGAIKPLLGGAALMCRGIQKGPLGDFPANTPVQIMAEGKTLPFAVGISMLSSAEIREADSGVGVEILHTLADGLWNTPQLD